MKEEKKKKRNFFSIIGEVILWALAIFCLSSSICNIIDSRTNYGCSFFGYRTSVIVSESMQYRNPENAYLDDSLKQIAKYDVIIAKEVGYEEIEIYDVVLHVAEEGLICHRVVNKYESDGVNYLVTRGDSNNLDDAPFAYSLCRGKIINVIPKLGQAVLFMQSGYFILGLFLSVFTVSGLCFLFSFLDKRENKNEVATSGELAPLVELPQESDRVIAINSDAQTHKRYAIRRFKKRCSVIKRAPMIKKSHKRYRIKGSGKQKKGAIS